MAELWSFFSSLIVCLFVCFSVIVASAFICCDCYADPAPICDL